MATKTIKLSDIFNQITNPSGGIPLNMAIGGVTTPSTVFKGIPGPVAPAPRPTIQSTPIPTRTAVAPAPVTPAPVAPVRSVAPVAPTPVGQNPSAPPVGPIGSTGAAPASQSPIPKQWLRADGTIKTPQEIADEVAGTLKATSTSGDIGNLARSDFSTKDKSVEDLRTDARRIGNVRNDIAVGDADPYKVGADSGVAYTPAELQAIEKAYAGIYDPALDSALSKVESKQASDKAAAQAAADEKNTRLKAELDANQPFTLGKDQVRYGADGKPLAVGIGSDTGAGGTYVAGQNPVVDAYVKGFGTLYKASDIPDQYKDLVAQGVSGNKPALSKNTNDAISIIDELTADPNLEKITGFSLQHPSSLFPGTAVQSTQNLAKQLSGILALQNRTQLKGSGAISDFEFRVLGDASSALGIGDNGRTNLSPQEFQNQLNKLKLKLQVGETNLTDDELLFLQGKGYTPEQIQDYSQTGGFNDVGNTTASTGTGNRPQRNNNPGNVKEGGLADALAVGKDDQGHLQFKTPEDGFKALTMDVTAKINGASKYLPANPTIAQLGKVYAEDPNWPVKVAAIIGVPINTHTQAIPLDKLVKAIARQEGFYA